MNNRVVLGILGAVAAIAVLFAIVQSSNLGQAQTDLTMARNTATAQAAKDATMGAQIVTAAAAEATGAFQTAATAQANAVADAEQAAATAQANAVAEAEQAAATEKAQAVASAEAQATGTLSVVIAQASTAQAEAVEAAENAAAVQQEQALASAAVEATTTLGAVVNAAATTQAEAEQAAATERAEAVNTVEAQATATLGAVVQEASTAQALLVATNRAGVTTLRESFSATQAAVEGTLTAISGQLATVTALPTATPQPTIEPREPKTPGAWCEDALPAKEPETRTFRQAEQVLQANVDYFAILCTGAGPVYVDLTEKLTPLTVNNFVFLAQAGYYNNTTFHRVLPDFMAQGGDPTGSGSGGPGYEFGDEIVPSLRFDVPGRLAMANAGPNTNGSQFFITFGPQTFLDGDYSIFGQVVEGQANVRKIELRDPSGNPREAGTTLDTVLIITDPTLVKLSESKPPTQEEVVEALDAVDSLVTSDLASSLTNEKLNQTSDEVVDAAPEAVQPDLAAFFAAYHHQYRVSSVLNNTTCDASQIQFFSVGYTLDAFATEADAAAAVADPVLEQLALKSGFDGQRTSAMLPHPYFTVTETLCDQRVIRAMTFWRHGTFISTVSIVLPADVENVTDLLDVALLEFVAGQIYEPFLTEILYSGIE